MTEIDPSVILKDGDCIYFRGEKYQKVEKPKPKTLYKMFCEEHQQFINREFICEIVERWLGDVKIEKNTTLEYNRGWNGCLEYLRNKLK